ncbi:hypothetical protein EJF36_15720 [Bacillus sp. HMF5848]|uniref:PepSY domain-containing protein n=1 Tax=Bacillus sp. HMF5848 TaxID=2495421 RepID=UPI000F7ACC1A|nr:PepSY domain-containing protein [Bacillus sp. HMF5848]RSK28217.1 hypothetical protein EJF36_15720 [Bacillus sp. HMF5848]
MGWRRFAFGIGIGIAGAVLLQERLKNKDFISGEKALKLAKNALSEVGTITGSWIQMFPEEFTNQKLSYSVYTGGLTLSDDRQLEFMVDAKTGTVLDYKELT